MRVHDLKFTDYLQIIAKFTEEKLIPAELEVSEKNYIPQHIIKEMRELGLFGISIPKVYGGHGFNLEEEMLIIFELCRASPVFRSLLGQNIGTGAVGLMLSGTEEQKAKYLPSLASGELISAFALTEPEAGSDAASISTVAVRDGDHYVVNGTKRFVTNAPEAGLFTVFARTGEKHEKYNSISALLIDKATDGIKLDTEVVKMGQWGGHVCDVIFDNCRVPVSSVIGGEEGAGFNLAMSVLSRTRTHIAAVCVGAAERILQEAINYAKGRKQFNKNICDFQLVQGMLADSKAEALAARSMVVETAKKYDIGTDIKMDSACCKLFASEMVCRVADRAVQILGGYGYIRGNAIERFYRDVRLFRIFEGTSQVQQLIIAAILIGKE